MSDAVLRAESIAERYGPDVLEKLFELAPLVAGTGNAWRRAVTAVLDGDDGTLVVYVPGLPGEPPRVTWMGAGWRVIAEEVAVDTRNITCSYTAPTDSL